MLLPLMKLHCSCAYNFRTMHVFICWFVFRGVLEFNDEVYL